MSSEAYQAAEQLCAWLRGEAPPVTDWSAVIALAAWQGLAAVLYKQLKAAGVKALVPPESWTLLQETYFDSAGRCLRRQYQIARVLRAFQEAGIPVITLKGPHLGAVVYDDPALRPMQDLDVLLKPEDLPRAEDLLRAAGYTLYGDRAEYEREHFHFHYHLPDPAELPVELHWHLLPPEISHKLDMAELWQRAQSAQIAGIESWVLAPADLLVYLCLHTAYVHVFEGGLKACYDIKQVLAHYGGDLDWSALQEQARLRQIIRPIYIMLYLAYKFFVVDIPADVLNTSQLPMCEPQMFDWVIERILVPEPTQFYPESTPLPFKSFNLAQFWKAERFVNKISILLTSLFPSPQILSQRYPVPSTSKKIYLYYILNVKDMVIEHLPVVWRLWQHQPQITAQAEEKLAAGILQQQIDKCEHRKTSIKHWLTEQKTSIAR